MTGKTGLCADPGHAIPMESQLGRLRNWVYSLFGSSQCMIAESTRRRPAKVCGALRSVRGVSCELYWREGR